jgi:hypothetical protein
MESLITVANTCVLLPWVTEIGWKMQSILLSGLRAPDYPTKATKKICRWMRAVTQNNADPSKGYMEPQILTKDLMDECVNELEYLTCHYVHHFADALRVIAIYCPQDEAKKFAWQVHNEIATEIFHFVPENMNQFKARHADKV